MQNIKEHMLNKEIKFITCYITLCNLVARGFVTVTTKLNYNIIKLF